MPNIDFNDPTMSDFVKEFSESPTASIERNALSSTFEFGGHTAVNAFLRREMVYIDGVRYYSDEGIARLGPRGKYSRISATDGEWILARYYGEYRRIPFDEVVYGACDCWWTEPLKPAKAPSLLAPGAYVRETTAKTWFEWDAPQAFILDWKIVTWAHGQSTRGRGKTFMFPSVHGIEVNNVELGFSSKLYSVRFSNAMQDVSWQTKHANQMRFVGMLYEDANNIMGETPIYIAGPGMVFTRKGDVELAFDAGIAPKPTWVPVRTTDSQAYKDAMAMIESMAAQHHLEGDDSVAFIEKMRHALMEAAYGDGDLSM